MEQCHATSVLIDGIGVLIRGPAGSGKSDLALRLIDGGAALVADDRVNLTAEGEKVRLSAPDRLKGLIEVRGVGLAEMATADTSREAFLGLVVDLVPREEIERLPDPETCMILEHEFPLLRLAPFETSTPAKVRLAVKLVTGGARRLPLDRMLDAEQEME